MDLLCWPRAGAGSTPLSSKGPRSACALGDRARATGRPDVEAARRARSAAGRLPLRRGRRSRPRAAALSLPVRRRPGPLGPPRVGGEGLAGLRPRAPRRLAAGGHRRRAPPSRRARERGSDRRGGRCLPAGAGGAAGLGARVGRPRQRRGDAAKGPATRREPTAGRSRSRPTTATRSTTSPGCFSRRARGSRRPRRSPRRREPAGAGPSSRPGHPGADPAGPRPLPEAARTFDEALAAANGLPEPSLARLREGLARAREGCGPTAR